MFSACRLHVILVSTLNLHSSKKIPVITDFTDEDGHDRMKEMVQENYNRIKEEVKQIVRDELERIAGDNNLKHLLQQK